MVSEVRAQAVDRHLIVSDIDAALLTSVEEIKALTSAATMAAYYPDGLDAEQLAASRRVVWMSANSCFAAAVSSHQHFAAAYDEAGLAGFVIATRHAADDLELDWLMVHPRCHGLGVADRLMAAGLAWLGPDKPVWLNVLRHNERAIRFYRRHGFEIDPDTATAHAVPHWVMRRPAVCAQVQAAA